MDPLAIYASMLLLCGVVLVLIRVFRHQVTRTCPLCDAQVELGKPSCQSCGYRFSTARY
jgi:predicted amidophosphoribosyltransferase